MNILNINKFYYLRGGAERYYFSLTKLLEAHGHDVVPFSMQDERNFPSAYAKHFISNLELGKPGLRQIKQISRSVWSAEAKRALEGLLDEVKIDIAHIHLIYHHLSPSILPLLKKRGIPVVMTLHDYKLICPNYLLYTDGKPCERCRGHKYYNAVLHRCLKKSVGVSAVAAVEMSMHKLMQVYERNIDVFIAPSEFVKNEYVKFGQDASKIVVIPHFIDPSFLEPLKLTKMGKEEAPYMIYAGRLSSEKGIDKLLETFYIYKPHLALKIAGSGPLLPWLQDYIQKRGLQNKVELLGHVSTETLRELIAKAQLTVVPSRVYETFGFSALESIAMGTPVVGFAMGGLTEIVTPDVGVLVPLDDRAALAQAMEDVSKWDKKRVATSAKALITERYLPERHMQALQTVYDHLRKR